MKARDIIEIVKESRLWEMLTPREKHDAIKHALDITYLSLTEEEIRSIVGEVQAG